MGARYDEVIAYLDDLAPSGEHELLAPAAGRAQRWKRARELESENRLIGLDTPVPAGNGSRMMEKMGWQPGESLGKARLVHFVPSAGSAACSSHCSVACGLLEPLRPVEPSQDRCGLGFTESDIA